jgi:DNA-3-methyladenine glycosylase
VLIRGIEPIEGLEVMSKRRGGRAPVGAGPGRLAEALGISDGLYGHDLREAPLTLERGWTVPQTEIGVSPRVGVSLAADWPYRFYVRGSPGVSRRKSWGAPCGSRAVV